MQGDEHPSLVRLRSVRERVLDVLSEAFTRDQIGLDEFESRVDRAYGCTTTIELAGLVRDLVRSPDAAALEAVPVSPGEGPPRGTIERAEASAAIVPASARKPGTVAIFGSVERRGHFALENGSRAVAIFGNVEIDLRDVSLPPGVTELHVRAVLGNVEITVPPNLAVESEGSTLLGSFSAVNRMPREGSAEMPVLRVIGKAVLGNVEVHTRPRKDAASSHLLPARKSR